VTTPRASSRPAAALRCAIYTRKSTSAGLEQEFNSLDAQYEACVAYLQRQPGWALVATRYDDGGFTGANVDRPAFQRLLADIDARRIDVVLVYKVDRLSRSLLDFASVIERFHARGAAFVSITQNFSTADAMGRLTLNMLMSFAEFEREMIGERTRDKIAASRRKGKWTGGPVPLGYTACAKKLIVDAPGAAIVRDVFALYHDHRSALAVVRTLHQRGQLPRTGARPWTTKNVLAILKNPIYAGYVRSDGESYRGEHEALVDDALFERTQALLAAATHVRVPAVRNPEYLLRGLLRCACCDSLFTPASSIKGNKTHRYYRSNQRDKQGREACRSGPLAAAALEDYVLDRVRAAIADGQLAIDVTAAVKVRLAARRAALAVDREQLRACVAKLSSEIRPLVDAVATASAPIRPHLEARLQQASDELACANARLADVERDLTDLDAVEIEAAWVASCLADFRSIWDVLTLDNRTRLLRAVVDRVVVDEAANELHVYMADLGAAAAESMAAAAQGAASAPPATDLGTAA
jgi:site-specific DNA recombinase